ncbi:MAG: hypothetical protein IJN57_06950 [Oscillospiraceae bacterium]|nr:hypothetical protein [Oscillospiraceae bacterium]
MQLIWNHTALGSRRRRMEKAQKYVDRACLEKMTPYVPVGRPSYRNAGKLRDSGRIESPGRIVYTAPFARDDYYAVKNHKPPHGGNPQGTRLWFEVMKQKHSTEIGREAAKVMGAMYR